MHVNQQHHCAAMAARHGILVLEQGHFCTLATRHPRAYSSLHRKEEFVSSTFPATISSPMMRRATVRAMPAQDCI